MKKIYFLLFFIGIIPVVFGQNSKEAIKQKILSSKIYDEQSQQYYVFMPLPEEEEIRLFAQSHNVYFAQPDVLNLYMPDCKNAADFIKKIGYNPIKIAIDVWQISTQGKDILTEKINIAKHKEIKYITFEYYAYLNACPTAWNDNEARYGQLHLYLVPWVENGYGTGVPTHSIDSVDIVRPMHTPTSAINPNVVVTIIDSGVNTTNIDFFGNAIYAYDFVGNVSGNNLTNSNHGTKVAELAVAKANNNFGGVGVAHDYPFNSLDVGTDAGFPVSNINNALDYVYNMALANPNQKQVVNMSFSGGDPTQLSKIQMSYNLQNHTQVFFVAGAGNAGTTPVSAPAIWSEVFGIGATNNTSATRARWSSSNYGNGIDFMADGQNVWTMDSNGNFNLGNGTSFATPIMTGCVATLITQDPTADFDKIYHRLKQSATDLGTQGYDIYNGWGYARTFSALKYAVIEDVPTSIDCEGNANYTYNFTPKFYNSSTHQSLRECRYPNGQLVPSTTNAQGVITFQAVINTNNGFSATNANLNRLKYTFVTTNAPGCPIDILTLPISVTNLSTLDTPSYTFDTVMIYPNPAKEKINIKNINLTEQKDLKINIIDITGRIVKESILTNEIIDIKNLNNGIYFLQFIHPKYQKKIFKFIKE